MLLLLLFKYCEGENSFPTGLGWLEQWLPVPEAPGSALVTEITISYQPTDYLS